MGDLILQHDKERCEFATRSPKTRPQSYDQEKEVLWLTKCKELKANGDKAIIGQMGEEAVYSNLVVQCLKRAETPFELRQDIEVRTGRIESSS